MLKRLLVAFLLLSVALGAQALEYTDVYYDHTSNAVNEDGWGVFVVQSDTFQFMSFFIYDQNKNPTWLTANLDDPNNTGTYSGPLYATTGTYYGMPWNPSDHPPAAQVGTASFQPIDVYHATLHYTINGPPTVNVTKTIVRQTLRAYKMSGDYSGSMAGSVSGMSCDPAKADPAFRARYSLAVTQAVDDTSASLVFTFVDTNHAGIVCTASGPLTHFGRIYQIGAGGTLACTGAGLDGKARGATIDSLHPTGQGIEGKITGDAGGGCTSSLHFAAVLNVNN